MIDLCTIAFCKPDLIREQIRLLDKFLEDQFWLTIVDNSSDPYAAKAIAEAVPCCDRYTYMRISVPGFLHNHALNKAAQYLLEREAPYIGFLDHDVFPTGNTSLIEKIDTAGFYGIGQRHSPTNSLYCWPGFLFMSRAWIDSKAPRALNFDGIRGGPKADDGDCGSMNAELFEDEDWRSIYVGTHGYGVLREPDDFGLQSFGFELFDETWIHLSNGSMWKEIPAPQERERLALELLASF